MTARRKLYGKISADLRHHPKLIASAKALKLPRVYLIGHLISMWLGALEFAEDGDLWRGDEETTLRFFESLADIQETPTLFLDVFRRDRWLDDWLIHDWLDHAGELLVARHSSHNRPLLVAIYKKHNRVYGRGTGDAAGDPHPDGAQGKLSGSDWEVDAGDSGTVGDNSDPPVTLSPKPQALNPLTLKQKETKSPIGGMGERAPPSSLAVPRADFSILKQGSGARGCYPVMQAELTGDGLTHKEVFEAFLPLLIAHGLLSLESFYERVKRSRASPACWMMLYLDKLHAVYRIRDGGALLDQDADPVGMTMAGLMPNATRRRHHHTEAARLLFLEIMRDYHKSQKGGKSKWLGKLSGPTIVVELERRKGKASKIA